MSLSAEAQRLEQAGAERVAALRAQIEDGTYEVDLDSLAEAIVRKERGQP